MQDDFKDHNNDQNNLGEDAQNPKSTNEQKNSWNYNPGGMNQNPNTGAYTKHNQNYGTTGGPLPKNNDNYRWNFEDYQIAEQNLGGKSKKSRGLGVFGFLVSFVIVVGVVFFSGYGAYNLIKSSDGYFGKNPDGENITNYDNPNTPHISINDPPQGVESPVLSNGPLSTKEIAKMLKPSVVGVENYSASNTFSPTSEGSGIIINSEGYIITNAHVVEGAAGINIVLNNGETYSAKLIGSDKKTDLAVVKIEAKNLVAATFGNSDMLEDGDRVIAIGNPGGIKLAATTTQGIVSTAKRSFRSDSGFSATYIQTDAAINPGNSGGPLINEYGQVVGINSAKIVAEGYEGIGFAIPINEAKPIIDELIKNGYITGRTKIGISGQEVNETTSQLNNIPKGIYIYSIDPNSDLAGKNVTKGDIIVKIDGNLIQSFDDVSRILKTKTPADSVTLTIYRPRQGSTSGDTFDVSIKLMPDLDKPQ